LVFFSRFSTFLISYTGRIFSGIATPILAIAARTSLPTPFHEFRYPLFSDKQRLYFQWIVVQLNKALRTFYAVEESFDRNLEDLGWLDAERK
jgi:hypothetical protein